MQNLSTILIIDDDTTVIDQLTTHFRRKQYQVIATANPGVVVQTLENFEVQLLLLDLRMERVNGYEVMQKIRSLGHDIPVLIITAYYQDEKINLEKIGIYHEDVIEKPFKDFELIEEKIDEKLKAAGLEGDAYSEDQDLIYIDNKTRVMVVDDEKEILELLAEFLRERNYTVDVFGDGESALEKIQKDPQAYHIGIVDMSIPGLQGYELMQSIKDLGSEMKFIPVSAKYADEMKEQLSSRGFNPEALMPKPFDLPRLMERLKKLAQQFGTLS